MTPRPNDNADLPPKRALVDAYKQVLKADQAARHQRALDRIPKQVKRSPVVQGGLLVLALVAAAFILEPSWLGFRQKTETAVESDANLRLMMYMAGRRVHAYRKTNGAYPASLTVVGTAQPGLRYRLTSTGGFEITGERAGQTLRLTDADSLAAFLGPGMSGLLSENRR